MGNRLIEFKDGDGGSTQTHEPDTHADVLREVRAMGDNLKALSEKVMGETNELRKTVEKHNKDADGIVQEKVSKLQEAIVTKTEALEQKMTKRMDLLDVAMQRVGKGAPASEREAKLYEEACQFKKHTLLLAGSAKAEDIDEGAYLDNVSVDEYKKYCQMFRKLMRLNPAQLALSPEEMRFLTVVSDPDGGILVPATLESRVIERTWELDPIRQLATVVTVSTDALEILEDLDQTDFAWEQETIATTETRTPQFNKKRIPAWIQSARPRATQKLLEDANINVENWLAQKVADRFAREEGKAFVTGNGIQQPKGFLSYTTYADSTTINKYQFGQIEYVPTVDSVITADSIITLFYHLLEQYQMRATWLMNRLTVMKVMLLQDSQKRYLWQPMYVSGLDKAAPSALLGVPVRMSANMSSSAANAYPIALADWAAAYTIVDRLGINIQRDPYTVKPFVEFYTRRRVGGDVVNFQAIKLLKVAAT